jgi:hypothetical protein
LKQHKPRLTYRANGEKGNAMSKSRTAPYYLTKKQIIEMKNQELVNAFEIAVTDLTIAQNCRARIPQKVAKQVEWIRDEILCRMAVTPNGF